MWKECTIIYPFKTAIIFSRAHLTCKSAPSKILPLCNTFTESKRKIGCLISDVSEREVNNFTTAQSSRVSGEKKKNQDDNAHLTLYTQFCEKKKKKIAILPSHATVHQYLFIIFLRQPRKYYRKTKQMINKNGHNNFLYIYITTIHVL